mmetsp:Transcript_34745/g.63172  ORF Transcript_34745/g.63172 Transcript_34745/m.63172 type:complete len:1225 (-) Transcript_34745:64-3738(-)|eukprot:CAMPEP_0197622702 /NCGR_PEP_ID=MMETSP1338-20131121/2889_1 /TAXON_ID=43686 ORGANISM="Pelagodinium beii, Strain RCC1491" /NCGR_SAMPLE_ID=MMETSP1338 /ASSEMBLY_ACC=CAM_ASM_000754 /LENGTH=1224 /DNA_ID=CAMNT_0043192449 /DNA_START=78 /DNA_END=3752 /DNA_ORIENTATION=+
MEGFRPFESNQPLSSFWDIKENKNDPLVLDSWRHKQVADARNGTSSSGRGLGALDATLASMREDKHRTPHFGGTQSRALGSVPAASGNVGISGFSATGMSVDLSGHMGQTQQSVAELSARRREAIKAAFRRVDARGQGWVTTQELVACSQRFGHINDVERHQVVLGMCGAGALGARGPGSDASTRITFAMFAGYYQLLGSSIERDRDFEDLLRQHWGFSEVSDILDDMKNKFAMVGLAYAFRRSLESGSSPELSVGDFQQALGHVGMQYSTSDIHRLFDSFSPNGTAATLEVLRLTQHLTSASRPPTPLGPTPVGGPGPHISEVHSEVSHTVGRDASMSSLSPMRSSGGFKDPFSSWREDQNDHGMAAFGDTVMAPPEDGEGPENTSDSMRDYHAAMPSAPPEAEDTSPGDDMPAAPPEKDAFGKMPLEDTTEAPPEDGGDGEMAPEETDPSDNASGEMPQAPPEKGVYGHQTYMTYGQQPSYPSMGFHTLQNYGDYSQYGADSIPGASAYGSFGGSYMAPSMAQTTGSFGGAAPSSPPVPPVVSKPAAKSSGPVQLKPTGRRRAVTVGINYIGTPNQLSGCINDSDTFITLLTEDFGFSVSDIRQLRDDHPQRMPSRKNITAALNWLVKDASAGDHLFFHYSGHGSQRPDTDGDEVDGKDETIVPYDFQNAGMLADDDLRRMLVEPLPAGCRLTVVMDCCHSGTGLDLAYKAKVGADNSLTLSKKSASKLPRPANAEVLMISGCKDNQTSGDVSGGIAGNKAAGAMTTAFKTCIAKKKDATYHALLLDMRDFLKQNGFDQVPQLCTEFLLNFTEPFLPEASSSSMPPVPVAPMRPPQRRALTIGINYLSLMPGQGRLSGCINDSETIISVLKDVFKFEDGQICRLRDDRANMMPTKANMLASMHWLTQGAGAGDELFLHYSGHGGQQADANGDEGVGGKDDTLIPCDFQSSGQITDDELYSLLVESLPAGVRLWVIFDCCHSGSALDLPYKASANKDGKGISCSKNRTRFRRPSGRTVKEPSKAEVMMISGCRDDQTSADYQGSLAPKAAGAMTTAFRHVISPTITCEDLLHGMREFLKRNNFQQVPQMSSEEFIQLDSSYVNYETTKRNKTPTTGYVHQQMAARRDLQFGGVQGPRSPMRTHAAMPGSPMLQARPEVMDSRIHRLEEQILQLRQQSPMRQASYMSGGGFSPVPQHMPPSPMAPQGMMSWSMPSLPPGPPGWG